MMVIIPNDARRVKGEPAELSTLLQISNSNAAKRRLQPPKQRLPIEQYEHYVALVVDKEGIINLRSSQSLKRDKERILEPAYSLLQECLHSMTSDPTVIAIADYDANAFSNYSPCGPAQVPPEYPSGTISHPFRGAKRRRSGNHVADGATGTDQESPSTGRPCKTIELLAGDPDGIREWYTDAFMAVQQVSCRLIAKVWIKKIHQKKQSTHPYNGALPRDQPRDPERTKPAYWPPTVRHKEPDHITKDERISLLLALIEGTPQLEITGSRADPEHSNYITARDLLEAIEERRSDIKDGKWEILENIVRVRTFQEKFNAGELDESTVITVIDCSAETRRSQGETDAEIADSDGEHAAAQVEPEDGLEDRNEAAQIFTPNSSTRASPAIQMHSSLEQALSNQSGNAAVTVTNTFGGTPAIEESTHRQASVHRINDQQHMLMSDEPIHMPPSYHIPSDDGLEQSLYQQGIGHVESDRRGSYPVVSRPEFSNLQYQQGMQHWQAAPHPHPYLVHDFQHNGIGPRPMTMSGHFPFDGHGFHQPPTTNGSIGHHQSLPYFDPTHYSRGFSYR